MKNINRLLRIVVFIALIIALDMPISFASDQPGCPDYKPPADQGAPGGTSGTSTTSTATGQAQSTLLQVEGAIAGAMGQALGTIDSDDFDDFSSVFDSIGMDNEVAIYTEFETPSGVASVSTSPPGINTGIIDSDLTTTGNNVFLLPPHEVALRWSWAGVSPPPEEEAKRLKEAAERHRELAEMYREMAAREKELADRNWKESKRWREEAEKFGEEDDRHREFDGRANAWEDRARASEEDSRKAEENAASWDNLAADEEKRAAELMQ